MIIEIFYNSKKREILPYYKDYKIENYYGKDYLTLISKSGENSIPINEILKVDIYNNDKKRNFEIKNNQIIEQIKMEGK